MDGSLQQNMEGEQKCSTNEPPHTYFWNHFLGNFGVHVTRSFKLLGKQ